MVEKINYRVYFDQALQMIKSTRQPIANRPEEVDFNWGFVVKNKLFNFLDEEYEKYSTVLLAAQKHSIECFVMIIMKLFEVNGIKAKYSNSHLSNVLFEIYDENDSVLYLFREIKSMGDSVGINISQYNIEAISKRMYEIGAKSYKYIYLLFDKAYCLDALYKLNENDPTNGTNLYSVKWFFEFYFGKDEYEEFVRERNIYIEEVKDNLGYIQVKSLTPGVLVNFTKITKDAICTFDYSGLISKIVVRELDNKSFRLPEEDYNIIKEQFLNKKSYRVLLGELDFSESFITAEWLYDSMKRANAVDLTIVATGYFKAIEQILYELIFLFQTDHSITEESNLGAMATYVRNHMYMFRKDLSWPAKNYVKESIFAYAKLRNGYFHKHNIHEWDKIERIKKETFYLLFLLLGTFELTEEHLLKLKMPKEREYTDYYRLCRYIDYHSGNLFFLQIEGKEIAGIACYDPRIRIESGEVIYSGAYIQILGTKTIYPVGEDNLPESIYLGKINLNGNGTDQIQLTKVKKIFEKGVFLADEDENHRDY